MNNIFDYRVKSAKGKILSLRIFDEDTLEQLQYPQTEFSLHLSKRETWERESRHGAFLITQIYTEPLPNEEPSEFSEQGESRVEKQWHANLALPLFAPVRRAPQFACFPHTVATLVRSATPAR